MARTPITELDFFNIKDQLKTHLKGQDKFRDYDFEGSNMSVLLDVFAYNTYQNNFYTNMAISEMFLDSATMPNSVVSHAKELNYLPKSAKSAMAVLAITISDSNETTNSITIPKNTKFKSKAGNGQSFNFYTNKAYIATRIANGNYYVECVEVFEGELADEAFFIKTKDDKLTLSNTNIDTSSIRVLTNPANPVDQQEYLYTSGIFGVSSTDPVFYLQPSFDEGYEIYFGRDMYGKTPAFNDEIRVAYRVTNNADANNSDSFTTDFRANVYVATFQNAFGGTEKESLEDTKFFAPKSIQTQERAVTRRDYETLLKNRFNNILDVSVYDGSELDPPQFGKVAISVNINGGISENNTNEIIKYLEDKTPIAIQPVFVKADFMYIDIAMTVYVDENTKTKSNNEIIADMYDVIETYNLANLEKFSSTFRISRLTNLVDNKDNFILSNTVEAEPFVEYNPELGIKSNPKFSFGGALIKPYPFSAVEGFSGYKPALKSSVFTYDSTSCFLQDDGIGNIHIVSADVSNIQIINPSIGIIDYTTGIVKLSDFIVSAYVGTAIKMFANTIDRNITSPKNLILKIRKSDVNISIVGR